jgi:hypothetical protein
MWIWNILYSHYELVNLEMPVFQITKAEKVMEN